MDLSEDRKFIVEFLNYLVVNYPTEIPLSEIEDKFGKNTSILVMFIQLFNVVTITQESNIKINSELAKNFISSLEVYFNENLNLINNWESLGNNSNSSIFESGVRFLHEMEERRVKALGSTKALRDLENITLIIKAKLNGVAEPLYLFQFDPESLIFKSIGGKIDKNDNINVQIQKLLKKELGLNKLNNNYNAIEVLEPVETYRTSTKTGVYTKHKVYFYFMQFDFEELKLSSLDRWLTLVELKNAKTVDNIEILSYFKYLEESKSIKFIESLNNLELSLSQPQQNKNFITAAKEDHSTKPLSKLEHYLKLEESDRLEFKSSLHWDYKLNTVNKALEKVIVKTLIGFLNSEGGTLIVGLDDDKNILGIDKDISTLQKKNPDGFMQYIIAMISSNIGIELSNFVDINFESKDTKQVCIIEVEKSPKPVFFKDGNNREFYIRAGNTTRELNIEEIYEYIQLNW